MGTESEQLRKIFVGGLNWETTEEKLHDYFSKWGNIVDCVIMRKDGRSRGFGFVTFDKAICVDEILKYDKKFELDEREIEPKRSVPRDEASNPTALSKTKKIFVGGLPSTTTESDISEYFGGLCEKFGSGKVVDIDLKKDRNNTARLRGFAFVTFDEEDVVEKVCAMRYHEIRMKSCEVKKAESQAVIRKRQEKDDLARGITRDRSDRDQHGSNGNNMNMSNMGGFMGNWGPGFFGSGMGGGFGGESSRGGSGSSSSEGRSGNFNPFMGFGPGGYGGFGPGFGGFGPGFGFGGMGFGNFGPGGFGFGGFGPGAFGAQGGYGGGGSSSGGSGSGGGGTSGGSDRASGSYSGSKSGYSNEGSSSRLAGAYGSAKSTSVGDRSSSSSMLGVPSQVGASRESATGFDAGDSSSTNNYGYGALAGASGGFAGTNATDWSNFNPAMFGYAAALSASSGGDAAKAYGASTTGGTAAADYATQMGNYLNQINSSYGPANRTNSRSLSGSDSKTGVRAYRPY